MLSMIGHPLEGKPLMVDVRRRLHYYVGFPVTVPGIEEAVRQVPARTWTPAYAPSASTATGHGSPS
jgi:hypothetical protein